MAKSAAAQAPISAATRFLILHGKDRFLADEYLRTLREALAKVHGKDGVDTVRFDGAQGARIMADVLDECRSQGLMQQYKVVLVDNADQLVKASDDEPAAPKLKGKRGPAVASAREMLESYAEDPSSSATLVLRAGVWRPGNLDKAVAAIAGGGGSVIKCEPPSEAEAIAWAQKRAKLRHQTSIDAQSAAMLIEAVGTELGRIDTEIEKLALAAGGEGQPITPELVSSMVGVSREDEFWAIQDSLLAGGAAAPLAQLRELIEVSRHDAVPITHSYLEMARKVHLAARGLEAGASMSSMAKPLKVFGWGEAVDRQLNAIGSAAKSAGVSGAAKLFAAAIATDAAGKSGLGEPVRNLEVLTVKFAAVTGRRR